MVRGNVIIDVIICRHSFVFGQSHAKVSAGFTNEVAWQSQQMILSLVPGGRGTSL